MVLMAALGAVGVIYGIEIGSNLLNKVAFGTMYGFIGLCIAVVLAFAINVIGDWI